MSSNQFIYFAAITKAFFYINQLHLLNISFHFLRFHAIEADIRLSRVFQKKKKIVEPPTELHITKMHNCYV